MNNSRWPFCGKSEYDEYLTTLEEIVAAAKKHGVIELTRYDRDLGKMVTDLVYDSTPPHDIVL